MAWTLKRAQIKSSPSFPWSVFCIESVALWNNEAICFNFSRGQLLFKSVSMLQKRHCCHLWKSMVSLDVSGCGTSLSAKASQPRHWRCLAGKEDEERVDFLRFSDRGTLLSIEYRLQIKNWGLLWKVHLFSLRQLFSGTGKLAWSPWDTDSSSSWKIWMKKTAVRVQGWRMNF